MEMLNINARERLAELEKKEEIERLQEKERSKFIYNIPSGEENALIVKFIVDPRTGERFVPMTYFKHKVGPGPKDIRTHVSLSSINRGKAPENEFYWQQKKALSALKKEGKGESAEAKRILELIKEFSPKNGGYIYVTQPGSPEVKVLKLNTMLVNAIFGRDGNEYVKSIRGVLNEGRDTGVSPYYLDRLDGWVKIWKTGKDLATEYKVEYHQVSTMIETKDGKKLPYKGMAEIETHPKILNSYLGIKDEAVGFLTGDDFPDVIEKESKYAWTVEESLKFVDALGSISGVPDRVLSQSKKDETDEENGPAGSLASDQDIAAKVATMDAQKDMPF